MKPVDTVLLAAQAKHLRQLLLQLAPAEPDAALLLQALTPLLQECEAGLVTDTRPFAEIPGDRLVDEGGLHEVVEVGDAYSAFKLTLSGVRDDPLFASLLAGAGPATDLKDS